VWNKPLDQNSIFFSGNKKLIFIQLLSTFSFKTQICQNPQTSIHLAIKSFELLRSIHSMYRWISIFKKPILSNGSIKSDWCKPKNRLPAKRMQTITKNRILFILQVQNVNMVRHVFKRTLFDKYSKTAILSIMLGGMFWQKNSILIAN